MSAHGPSLPSCVARLAFGTLTPGLPTALNIEFDMSDDPGVQFVGARSIKRSTRQMSHESAEGSQHSWQNHFHPSVSRADSRPPLLPPMNRYRHGDNAMPRTLSSVQPEGGVIDLTADPDTPPRRIQPHAPESSGSSTGRLPRFGRNIMTDVVDLAQESDEPAEGPPSSPEVQFVGATIRPSHQRLGGYHRPVHERVPAIDHYTAYRRRYNRTLPALHSSRSLTRADEMERLLLGVDLDYDLTSFSVIDQELPPLRLPAQPEPQRRDDYKAPSPPPEGFTRTLQEDDVAVCPNCSWELGTGEGKKEEIWVAKPCGHVYCGECAENRSKSKHKKTQGGPKTKAFHKCQVSDCGKTVSAPTAMFHLYL